MLIKVQYQKQFTEVVVEDSTDEHEAKVDDLSDAIEHQLDVPAHHQKLIVKGKVLVKGDPLAKYGLKDGSKVMLMASGTLTQGQIAARQQAELRREKAHQRMRDRSQAASSSAKGEGSESVDAVPASDKQSMPQRIKRWKATGIISLRALQLASIPEGFQQHLEALGPTTIASLYAVDVGNNCLEQLPDVFQSMQGLQRFRCSHNRLPTAGVPWATLSLLPRLSHVQVASNCLTFLDPVLCQASSLRLLDLSSNSLEALPADIGQLQHLEELDVSDNKLRRLPDSLGQCKQLARFLATNNAIEELPDTLGSLRALQILRLDGNRISTVPPAVLLGCVELHSLALRGNPVTMQALRDVEGWPAYEARRKGKLDKALDAHVHADFWEAADYERFRRH